MTERLDIPINARYKILARDNFTCQYCGKTGNGTQFHIDHIIPVSKGGETVAMNLITSCVDCNMGKLDMMLDDENIKRLHKIINKPKYNKLIDEEIRNANEEKLHIEDIHKECLASGGCKNTLISINKSKRGYTTIPNQIFNDPNLSDRARGLYCRIYRRASHNPNFTIYKAELMKSTKEGTTAFNGAWNELKKRGYIKMQKRIIKGTNRFEYLYELVDKEE